MRYLFANNLIIVRGGGDLATGVAHSLYFAGFKTLLLETDKPLAIRRTVAFCEAVYNGTAVVENVQCRRITSLSQMEDCHNAGIIPLLVDPAAACVATLKPLAVVDAILAKKNMGTTRSMAPITIGLGPGFTAPSDVCAVIETMRGHNLGRCLLNGSALPNTGTPGEIGGQSTLRVMHAANSGIIQHHKAIGDIIQKGEPVFSIDGQSAAAPFTGLLRGLIQEGLAVPKGLKVADIDPRTDVDYCTISDKARSLGNSVTATLLRLINNFEPPCFTIHKQE